LGDKGLNRRKQVYIKLEVNATNSRSTSIFLLSDAGSHLSPNKYAATGNSDSFRAANLGQYKI